MKQFRYLLLTLMLLGGQFALLAHAADLDAHAGGDECQICLHASSFDSGLIPATVSVAVDQTSTVSLPVARLIATADAPQPFDARGPPDARSA